MENAIRDNNLQMVRTLYEQGHDIPSDAMETAARLGHLDLVKWLADVKYLDYYSDSDDVKYHHIHNCNLSDNVMSLAIENGHVEVAKFLNSMGLMYDYNSFRMAVINGHLEMVKFLHSEGMQLYGTNLADGAAANGHLEVVKFLYSKGMRCSQCLGDECVSSGNTEIVRFLLQHDYTPSVSAVILAVRNNHDDMVRLVLTERPNMANVAIIEAIHRNRTDLATKIYWYAPIDIQLVMHFAHKVQATDFINNVRKDELSYHA